MTAPAKPIPTLPGPYSVAAVIDRLILVAGSQDGYREGHDSSGWNNDNAFGVWYGMNLAAWCAMFVSWAANKAGIPESVIYKHAYTPYGWKWFKDHGRAVITPQRGDIFYVYSASQGIVHHVGIVESVGAGFVRTIEGNTNTSGSAQGEGVFRLKRNITSALKFVRPDYAACVKPAPAGTPPATKPPVTAPVADTTIGLWSLTYATQSMGMSGITLHDAEQAMASTRVLLPYTRDNELGWAAAVKAGNWKLASSMFRSQIFNLQKHAGLKADGIPGPATLDYLRRACGYTIAP